MTRNGTRRRDAAPGGALARAVAPAAGETLLPVIFKGIGGHVVTGPESHQVYCFSSDDPEQMVDARDAEAFLTTGLFRIGV